jgi:hypothetical protein
MPSQHRRATEMHFPGLQHDRLIERDVATLVILAEEDAEQNSIMGDLHGHIHFIVFIVEASMEPPQTAIRHNITDRPIFPPARNHSPSFMRLSVCKLNEENVV